MVSVPQGQGGYEPLRTFDDVLLVPQYSEIDSRSEVNVSTKLKNYTLKIPIIAANMDTVCEAGMAIALANAGGMGVIHRYMSYERQLVEVSTVATMVNYPEKDPSWESPVAAAVGVRNGVLAHVENLVSAGANVIVVDVAHGHFKPVKDTIQAIKKEKFTSSRGTPVEVIAGNVATPDGALFLFDAGADGIKVGVGSGSICSTRLVTGHGIPQLAALLSIKHIPHRFDGYMIADGGLRTSGDIVKALAVGATAVMLGSMLAGTEETPGEYIINSGRKYKVYRGMSSREAQTEFYGNRPEAPEGITAVVPYKGPVESVLGEIVGGIRSGLSYSGASSIPELVQNARWVPITPSGIIESGTINPLV